MIPLLAVAGAVSAIGTIASGAASALQHLSSARSTAGTATAGGRDFAAILSSHGISTGGANPVGIKHLTPAPYPVLGRLR